MRDLSEKLSALQKEVADGLNFLKIDALEERLRVLGEEMQLPDFWANPSHAQMISREHGALSRKVSAWRKLDEDVRYAIELSHVLNDLKDDEEVKELAATIDQLEKEYEHMEIQLYLGGKYDDRPALVSVHAGAGGTDAQDWAEMILRMITRYAEAKGWKVTLLDKSDGESAGIKSATLKIEGDFIFGLLKEEAGVHRLVRLSPFNIKHTRETSFCMVDVVPEIEPEEVEIDDDDLRIDVYRAGGHGGQGVNKTDSAVRITHLPTGIVVQCQNERSQLQNKQTAMTALTSKLVALKEKHHLNELKEIRGDHVENSWGSQIRSYVLHPYQMAKDHRTDYETAQVDKVLEGDPNELDVFIEKSLKKMSK